MYLLLILAVVAALIVVLYNSLVKLRNKAKEAWADIDTQLKRRYDLIPNIVETVKGYASHEANTLQSVTEARTKAMGAQNLQEKEQAENMLTGALKSIFALAENYPDLKANQNFLQLQTTLKDIEEHVQMSRRYYNGTVRDLNNKLETFPNNLFGGMLGFKKMDFFQATDEEKKNVKVDFKEPSAGAAEAQKAQPQSEDTSQPTTEASATPAQPAPPTDLGQPAAPEAPANPAAPETPAEAPSTPENPPQQ